MHDFYLDLQSKNKTKIEITKPWQELWKSFTKHGEKQKAIEIYGKASRNATDPDPVFGSDLLPYSNYLPEGLASNMDALKQKCFYVDYVDTNFTEPHKLADIKIIDYLYSMALERLYSFGAWHCIVDRSLHLLKCKTNLINEFFDTDKNIEFIEKFLTIDFTPPSSEENMALQDFLYWLSHRSSSKIPDYSSFLVQGEKALSKLDKSGVHHVLSTLVAQIKEKLEVKEMPRTTSRHFKMMKLIISFSDMAVTKGLLRKRHFDAMFT
ncbi:AbiV family abortive infection protein [Aliarcobacter butzleri]